jgi:N-acyl homoserine lactone hydrolase
MPEYSIWALEFSVLPSYPDAALVYGAMEGARRLPFYYFALQSDDRLILIDAGFSDSDFCSEACASYGVVGFQPPATIMPRVGLRPEDVDTIIVTHHHWDHVSGLNYFPNAVVHIQKRDVESWMTKWTAPPRLKWLCGGLDPNTGTDLARIGGEGRLRLADGAADVAPGIQVRPAFDTHTAGSQYIVLQANDSGDPWVFPGDVAYVYDNIGGPDGDQQMIPIGLAQGSQECCVRATDEMLSVANDNIRRVLPHHEIRIFDRFPSKEFDDGLHVGEIALAKGVESRIGR